VGGPQGATIPEYLEAAALSSSAGRCWGGGPARLGGVPVQEVPHAHAETGFRYHRWGGQRRIPPLLRGQEEVRRAVDHLLLLPPTRRSVIFAGREISQVGRDRRRGEQSDNGVLPTGGVDRNEEGHERGPAPSQRCQLRFSAPPRLVDRPPRPSVFPPGSDGHRHMPTTRNCAEFTTSC
jgi:hypothetical protein